MLASDVAPGPDAEPDPEPEVEAGSSRSSADEEEGSRKAAGAVPEAVGGDSSGGLLEEDEGKSPSGCTEERCALLRLAGGACWAMLVCLWVVVGRMRMCEVWWKVEGEDVKGCEQIDKTRAPRCG